MQKNSLIFEQGDIAIASVPFSDGSGVKRRPVLIISSHSTHTFDVLAIKITATKRESKFSVSILPEDIEGGRLKVPSSISADFIVTIQKNLVSQKAGKITASKLLEVKGKLRQLFDL